MHGSHASAALSVSVAGLPGGAPEMDWALPPMCEHFEQKKRLMHWPQMGHWEKKVWPPEGIAEGKGLVVTGLVVAVAADSVQRDFLLPRGRGYFDHAAQSPELERGGSQMRCPEIQHAAERRRRRRAHCGRQLQRQLQPPPSLRRSAQTTRTLPSRMDGRCRQGRLNPTGRNCRSSCTEGWGGDEWTSPTTFGLRWDEIDKQRGGVGRAGGVRGGRKGRVKKRDLK